MGKNGFDDSYIRGKIDIAFARLIGPLAIMNELMELRKIQIERELKNQQLSKHHIKSI